MLTNFEAAILGIIQGLTEFLPISSSGHLVIAQILFGLKEPPLFYDVFLHLATLVAILLVLWEQVWQLCKATLRLPTFIQSIFRKGHLAIGDDPEAWTVVLILVTTAVTGVIGVGFEKQFKETFASIPLLIFGFFLTGLLLLASHFYRRSTTAQGGKFSREDKTPVRATLKDAAIIGLAQGAAILPSLSRSGTTISAALFLGFDRKFAGEYSFLVSLPAVLGAVILESRKGFASMGVEPLGAAIGFIFSLVLGVITLKLLLNWIRGGKTLYFAYYCFFATAVSFYLYFRGQA